MEDFSGDLFFGFEARAVALQVMAAFTPVSALLTDRGLVGFAEPGSVGLDPVEDVSGTGISLQTAAFAPFVDFDLLNLDLHVIVMHRAYSTLKYEPFQDANNIALFFKKERKKVLPPEKSACRLWTAQYARRQSKEGAQKVEEPLDGDPEDAKGQQQEPEEGIEEQCQQGERPAADEEQEPEEEFYHFIISGFDSCSNTKNAPGCSRPASFPPFFLEREA